MNTRAWFLDLNCDENPSKEKQHYITDFLTEDQILQRTEDCTNYFQTFPVLHHLQPNNNNNHNFPLAFSHLVHHEIGVLEAFLAVYFRPWDMHCIYIDRKASEAVRKAVNGLIKCYRQKCYPSAEEGSRQIFVHDPSELIYW